MKQTLNSAKPIWLIIILLLLVISSRAQVKQEVQNSFNLYKQSALQEKIYVHTDKSVYLPGEILWFKIYCVDGNDHKPLNLSKVVYIDLLDNNQTPIIQAKVAIKNGTGDGSIYIPVTVNSGNFHFRAYTNWMKNFSPDFYFEKTITLVNPLKSPDALAANNAPAFDIQFFPEGGSLVSGIASKVAFKTVGQNGKGLPVAGAVINQHNDTVARFRSLKFGMGTFAFTPAAGDSYKAVATVAGISPLVKELPEINAQGFVMSLTDEGSGQLDVTVKSNTTAEGNVYLFAHTRQDIKAAESASLINGIAHFKISKIELGEGVSHLTVFNTARQPVCERLYFKKPAQRLLIEASTDQQQYGLRKKININIQPKDANGGASDAELSMSVYKLDSLQTKDNIDIFSYLWLNSDLRGTIESPGYYFNTNNAETEEALDNLMLTQGWRKFQWNQLLDGKPTGFSFLPEYDGHIVTAKIVNTLTNNPAKNIITYMGIPGKRVQLYVSKSDSTGRLLYNTKGFYGPNEVIVQTNALVDSTYRIDVASPFSEQYSKNILPKFVFNAVTTEDLKAHSLGIQVMNIYSGKDIKQFYDPHIDSSAFFGKPYKTYKLDDFVRFTTMEEDLREYVSEDNIVNQKGHFHIKVLNDRGFLDGDPLALVDGIPVFNIDKIIGIDPLKVRKLDVVRDRYYYGPVEEEGIFSFTTYKGDLGGVDLDPHAVVIDYEGLQLRREFYSPVYDTEARTANRIPDLRNLLYWSPSFSSGTASFYSSDQGGKYIGVIQGLTANGDAASKTFTFEVK